MCERGCDPNMSFEYICRLWSKRAQKQRFQVRYRKTSEESILHLAHPMSFRFSVRQTETQEHSAVHARGFPILLPLHPRENVKGIIAEGFISGGPIINTQEIRMLLSEEAFGKEGAVESVMGLMW